MKIGAILDAIDLGAYALPEFQRGYVWGRDDVRRLMQSLYRQYPVGSLLVWQTRAETTQLRGGANDSMPLVKLLLDGQQRMTSLYGVIRGTAPAFFQGNPKAFSDLYFDLRTESFEFYGPVKMGGDPLWANVTEVFRDGLNPWFSVLGDCDPEDREHYLERLSRLQRIRDIELHIEEIVGSERTLDEVVDIFNRVNSGGTKLSKGDLALARICAEVPTAREELNLHLRRWKDEGYNFKLEWFLRVVNAKLTGGADFVALRDIPGDRFTAAIPESARIVDDLLNLIASRLGLDHDRVLPARYAFPLLVRHVDQQGWPLSKAEQDRILWWYVHAFMWGRYSGSTETTLQQDLDALDEGGFDAVIDGMRKWRGDLRVTAEDFAGSERGSRFYPLLYLLSRVHGARSVPSGIELRAHLLGRRSSLELHHIFPKAVLQRAGYDRADRNALANFCFLTQADNRSVSDRLPNDYLTEFVDQHGLGESIRSQWIPEDRSLWEVDRYAAFLAARRELLAAAANEFLDSLRHGGVPEPPTPPIDDGGHRGGGDVGDEWATDLGALRDWFESRGVQPPEIDHEIVGDDGEVLVVVDAAWPDGLQAGRGGPVALLLEPDAEMEARLGQLGYRFFVSVEDLVRHVEAVVGLDLDRDGHVGAIDDGRSAGGGTHGPLPEGPAPPVELSESQRRALAQFDQHPLRTQAVHALRRFVAVVGFSLEELGGSWGITVVPRGSSTTVVRVNVGLREVFKVTAGGMANLWLSGSPRDLGELAASVGLLDGFDSVEDNYALSVPLARLDEVLSVPSVADGCRGWVRRNHRTLLQRNWHNPATADLVMTSEGTPRGAVGT
jgi:hypothetical protein